LALADGARMAQPPVTRAVPARARRSCEPNAGEGPEQLRVPRAAPQNPRAQPQPPRLATTAYSTQTTQGRKLHPISSVELCSSLGKGLKVPYWLDLGLNCTCGQKHPLSTQASQRSERRWELTARSQADTGLQPVDCCRQYSARTVGWTPRTKAV